MRAISGVASCAPRCAYPNTLTAVLVGFLDLTHLAPQSLGRVLGRTSRKRQALRPGP